MKKILSLLAIAGTISVTAQTVLIDDNFDDGNISGWTESSTGIWEASTDAPINGASSLKHVPKTSASSYIQQQVTSDPAKSDMSWYWTWNPDFEPTQGNTFWFTLLSDNSDLGVGNGYALGINMASGYDDVLKFYKVTGGTTDAFSELLNFGSTFDINQGSKWAFYVTRNSVGKWEISVDQTGGSNYTLIGTTVDDTYKTANPFTGVFFKHTTSTGSSKLRVDDIKVTTTQGEATPTINLDVFKTDVREGQEITVTALASSALSSNKTLTLNFAGTASAGDYSALASTITIPAGATKGSTTLTIKTDAEFEATESLNLSLSAATGVTIGKGANLSISDDVRVMHYNLLRYPNCKLSGSVGCTVEFKNGHLKTILGYAQPDIFGVNEMLSADPATPDALLNGALNVDGKTHYKRAAIDHPSNSEFINMLYYNSNKFELYSQETIKVTGQRETNLYTLYFKSPELATVKDTIFLSVIQSHLKAGSGVFGQPGGDPQNLLTRDEVAKAIMDRINTKVAADSRTNYIVMGDFNLYDSTEPAYQTFLNYATNPAIRFQDPINAPGIWSADKAFAYTHTQATRFANTLGDNGGSGGMDDRFDFILTSKSIISGVDSIEYIPGTYTAFGQDGNRYGKDVNSVYSTKFPPSVMDALYFNSDHLPVISDFKFKFKNEVTKFIADKTEICGGATSIKFIDQSTNNPNGWTWDFGDGSSSTSQNPTKIYTTGGKYTVKLTVNKTAGGTDAATITDYITIYDTPSTANAGTDISTCNITSATLAATAPTKGTGTWSVVSGAGNIEIPGDFNSSITDLVLDNETVLKWTINNGTCTPSTDEVKINAHSNPDATITNNKTVCISDVLKLTSKTAGGTWTGTAVNSTTEEFNATTAGIGTHKVTYTVKDINNCSSTATADITVRSTFDATITTTQTTILSSEPSIIFTATDDGGTWGGSTGINAVTGVFDPAKATEGDNTITYTFTGNCAANASHTITVFKSSGFDDFADGNITTSPTWVGQTASYTVNTDKKLQINAAAAGTYYISTPNTIIDDAVWQFNYAFDGGTSSSNMAEVYLVSDVADLSGPLNGYHVRIGNTADEVNLMRKKGTSNSTLINGTDKLIDTNPVNITVKVTRSKAGDWELFVDPAGGTNFISQGTKNDLTFTSTSFFGVATEVTKSNITKMTYDNFVISGTSPITGNEEVNSFESSVYPNPTSELITIQTQEIGTKNISVYNTFGQVVKTDNFNGSAHTLRVSDLANGVYSIIIASNNKSSVVKISISK